LIRNGYYKQSPREAEPQNALIGNFRELKPPNILIGSFRELKPPNILIGSFRGTKPLSHHLPLPLVKGKGDKGG